MKKPVLNTNKDPYNHFHAKGIPYNSCHGGNAATYETKGFIYKYREPSAIKKKELHIIQKALRDIQTAKEAGLMPAYTCDEGRQKKTFQGSPGNPETIKAEDIRYFDFNMRKGVGTYKGVTEIDLNSAYWEIAHKLGYISEKTYKAGLKVSKPARLAALGSAAKVSLFYHFDGRRENFIKEERRETAPAFFHICKTLGELMLKVTANIQDFVFGYYVDAFFVDDVALWSLERELKKCGFSYKIIPLESLTVYPDRLAVRPADGSREKIYTRMNHRMRKAQTLKSIERVKAMTNKIG